MRDTRTLLHLLQALDSVMSAQAEHTALGSRPRRVRPSRRRGVALLVCIFTAAIATAVIVAILDTQTLQMAALRNTEQYEQASYLATAAVYHAIALIDGANHGFTPLSVGPIEYPAGSGCTYQAEATSSAGNILIIGVGNAHGVRRQLQVTATEEVP